MLLKKMLLLVITFTIATHSAQATQFLYVRNQSPSEVQFTIPDREVENPRMLRYTPTQTVIIAPLHESTTVIRLAIPDDVKNIWVTSPHHPDAPWAKVCLQEIFIMTDPKTVYDIYVSPEPHFSNFIIALFCHGFLDMHKIMTLKEAGYYSVRPYESTHRKLCFPIFSKKSEATQDQANKEVVELTQEFSREYSRFLLTYAA